MHQTSRHRGFFAEVAAQAHNAHCGILPGHCAEKRDAIVSATVIDEDDFVWVPLALQQRLQSIQTQGKNFLLIKERNNDGKAVTLSCRGDWFHGWLVGSLSVHEIDLVR